MASPTLEASPSDKNLVDFGRLASALPSRLSKLPSGRCNFVDLATGSSGAQCGCRRFWARQNGPPPSSSNMDWCMCSHHACYHDEDLHDGNGSPSGSSRSSIKKSRTRPEPPSPLMLLPSWYTSHAGLAAPGPLSSPAVRAGGTLASISNEPADVNYQLGVRTGQQPVGSLPDTLKWEDFVQPSPSAIGPNSLPPIPSQCLMPSQTASSTSSVRAAYLRPFFGKGLQTLGTRHGPSLQSPLEKSLDSHPAIAPQYSQGADALIEDATQLEPRTVVLPDLISAEKVNLLADTVKDHGERLDKLESVSFSDECHENHEQLDARMSELESRIDDVERHTGDNFSLANERQGHPGIDKTHYEASSTASTAGDSNQNSPEFVLQLRSLQAQVTHLQSYLPSPVHAWKIEVVFLPFPVKRLWQKIDQFRADTIECNANDDDGDAWTQLPMTNSAEPRRSLSPFCNQWTPGPSEVHWLLPRACGDASLLDCRLRSRGLVRTVTVKGPDYRSVQAAVQDAFGTVFRDMQLSPRSQACDSPFANFLGLQQSWVPLRKMHKDSRLRFLSPAEMMTPGLWDVQFLNAIMMRSAAPRLFITHPDAYLQDLRAYEAGWTWNRVRQLKRIYPDTTESQSGPDGDGEEEYWAWNEQLDGMPGTEATETWSKRYRAFGSPPLAQAGRFPLSRSTSPFLVRGSSTMLDRRRCSVPPRIRTTSNGLSPVEAKRGMQPLGARRTASPGVRGTAPTAVLKRRRTRSPNRRYFTPAWTASPSPLPRGPGDWQAARGGTPFAYATPYSNAPLQEIRPVRGSSVARAGPVYAADIDFELPDVDIYESASEGSFFGGENEVDDDDDDDDGDDDGENDDGGERRADRSLMVAAQARPRRGSQQQLLPEDEPWPGIEDEAGLSDGENIDPQQRADDCSEASSTPSEYPSTRGLWPDGGATGFRIHEDEED